MSERIYYSHEAAQRARHERMSIATFSAVLGVIVGVIIALVWGSKNGDATGQLGENVSQLLKQGSEFAQKMTKDVVDNASKVAESVADSAASVRS